LKTKRREKKCVTSVEIGNHKKMDFVIFFVILGVDRNKTPENCLWQVSYSLPNVVGRCQVKQDKLRNDFRSRPDHLSGEVCKEAVAQGKPFNRSQKDCEILIPSLMQQNNNFMFNYDAFSDVVIDLSSRIKFP
jgi:hypothetical protein